MCTKYVLFKRYFNVLLNNSNSNYFPLTSSVPKCSELRPIFYILYANDLANTFRYAKIKMYTDDLTIYALINNESDKNILQTELDKLCKWADVL